jgi:hypothetical protein
VGEGKEGTSKKQHDNVLGTSRDPFAKAHKLLEQQTSSVAPKGLA